MCGIAGIIGCIDDEKINIIKNMISILSHRGPDKQRILKTKNSLLAFSRLKIIDFNTRAMQPMISNDRKNVLIFNGEIYNYKKLKKKIEKKYFFRTKSDSEVLLAMLKIYGKDCLKEINGMFAFCFFDAEKNTYILARDRFGQKPLYYCNNGKSIYFASEIKSLLVANIKKNINLSTVYEYLKFGKMDYKQDTWFHGINQLEAGEILQIKDTKIISKTKWYNLEKRKKIQLPKKNADRISFINEVFLKVCEEHLNSDTKIGTKLSGGLDSSTMLASMEKNRKYLSNQCFSVDFGSSYTEKDWITEVANHFRKKLYLESYCIDDFVEDFGKMIFTHEGPLGGLMNCAFEKVYKKAKMKNIRVLLDGTGLDEAFGGYRIHHLVYLNKIRKSKNINFERQLIDYAKKWEISKKQAIVQLDNLSNHTNYVQDGTAFNQNAFITKELDSFKKEKVQQELTMSNNVHEHFINYITCSKIPKNTRIKDRQSMSHSIELRMPFLDHRIIELGLSLEENRFFNQGLTKSTIRDIMKDKLPEKVRGGQKRSIQSPQGLWLKSPKVVTFIKDIIYSESFKNRGILNTKNIKEAYENFLIHGAKNTFHIWQWINIEFFLKTYYDKKVVCSRLNEIEYNSL